VILVALGSNLPHPRLGPPRAVCEAALRCLAELGVTLRRRSRWYASAPVPVSDQPWFVNGVAEVSVPEGATPADLLALLHRVEAEFGRHRQARNEARVLDLDLVDFDGRVSTVGEQPELPHPRLSGRGFVILPLQELAPDWRHPATGESIGALADALPSDQRQAEPLE